MNLKYPRLPTSAHLRPKNAKNHPVSTIKDPKGLPILIIFLNIIQPINFDLILSKQNNNWFVQVYKIWANKKKDKMRTTKITITCCWVVEQEILPGQFITFLEN